MTDPALGNNSATDNSTLTPEADLAVTKTDGQVSDIPGTSTGYTITVTNGGPSCDPSVSVADTFVADLTGVTWTCAASGGASCGTASGSGNIGTTDDLPVWLRMARVGNVFNLYFSYTTNNPPVAGDWTLAESYNLSISDPVLVGLANASYSSNTANTVTFDNFHLCIDPADATGCGTVQEAEGQVVINATNYTDIIERKLMDQQRSFTPAENNSKQGSRTFYVKIFLHSNSDFMDLPVKQKTKSSPV